MRLLFVFLVYLAIFTFIRRLTSSFSRFLVLRLLLLALCFLLVFLNFTNCNSFVYSSYSSVCLSLSLTHSLSVFGFIYLNSTQ